MATKSTTSRTRSTGTRAAPARKRRASTGTTTRTAKPKTVTEEAKTAIRSVRTRATRAVKKVPTDRTTLSVAAGILAGIVAAGYAIFVNRERLRTAAASSGEAIKSAASTGSEKLKKAADDLSTMAHDRIDQARDNITRLRGRSNSSDTQPSSNADSIAITG